MAIDVPSKLLIKDLYYPFDLILNSHVDVFSLFIQDPFFLGLMLTFLLVANRKIPFFSSSIALLISGS